MAGMEPQPDAGQYENYENYDPSQQYEEYAYEYTEDGQYYYDPQTGEYYPVEYDETAYDEQYAEYTEEQYDQQYEAAPYADPNANAAPPPPASLPDPNMAAAPPNAVAEAEATPRGRGLVRPEQARISKRERTPSPSRRIDEKTVPRVEMKTSDEVVSYRSSKDASLPPGSRTQFVVEDGGNASPRHIRMTLYSIPSTSETADRCNLAIAAVVQPLANLGLEEEDIPVVDHGEDGPIRCTGCRAYINPHVRWGSGGAKWICNLCQLSNDVPTWYRGNLDGQMQRRDRKDKFELHRGAVDFVAPKGLIDMMSRDPVYFFVIDVSPSAYHRGLVDASVEHIRSALAELRDLILTDAPTENGTEAEDDGQPTPKRNRLQIGFLTYDSSLHFHRLSDASLHIVSEVNDPFVALPKSEVLVPILDGEKFNKFDELLGRIPDLFRGNEGINDQVFKNCCGAAVGAAVQVMADCGGKVFCFQSKLCEIGIGSLKQRDVVDVYETLKERELYMPADSYYQSLALECAECFICVDLFACAAGYVDLASVGELSRKTGGQIYYYPNFSLEKDDYNFSNDLRNDLLRLTVFNGVMAVRSSSGLEPVDFFGNFYLTDEQEMQLPCVTSDTTVAVRLAHYGELNTRHRACIQVALLYCTMDGDVLIRVHTLSLPIVRRVSDVYRAADLDAVVNVSLKQCAFELIAPGSNATTVKDTRNQLVGACVDILHTYRRFCASNSASGQLVLPESLKLLPLFTLALIKNLMLSDRVSSDERSFLFAFAMHMPTASAMTFVHPHCYPIHLLENGCYVTESTRTVLPRPVQLSKKQLVADGIFLLDNGRRFYVCVGEEVPRQFVDQAFDLLDSHKLVVKADYNDSDANDMGYRLNVAIEDLRYDKPYFMSVDCLYRPDRANSTLSVDQQRFLSFLVEDASRVLVADPNATTTPKQNVMSQDPSRLSYVDFLVVLHKKIQIQMYD